MYFSSFGNRIFRGATLNQVNFREKNNPEATTVPETTVSASVDLPTDVCTEVTTQQLPEPGPGTEADTATKCSKGPQTVPPQGEDDLPLGIDANLLNEMPTDSTPKECKSDKLAEASPNFPEGSPTSKSATKAITPLDKTQQWLQTLAGKQQSFSSDFSTGTNSSLNSIELLLQGREADPEEILMSLGFGTSENTTEIRTRIPPRFFSDSSDSIIGQRTELQDLIDSWKTQKSASGNWSQSPRLASYFHGIKFLSSMQVAAQRTAAENISKMPLSILTPDNQLALAEQGFYDFPTPSPPTPGASVKAEEEQISLPTTARQLSLPAAERRKNFKSARSHRPWSLIEPDRNGEYSGKDFRLGNNFAASVDSSSMSSDFENNVKRQRPMGFLHRSYVNQSSRDSESLGSSIRDLRTGQVDKLMSFDEDDGDYDLGLEPKNYSSRGISEKDLQENALFPKILSPKGENENVQINIDINTEMNTDSCLSTSISCAGSSSGSTKDFKPEHISLDNIQDASQLELRPESPPANNSTSDYSRQLPLGPLIEGIHIPEIPVDEIKLCKQKISEDKSPSIYRIGSAQSDSSGFAEPDGLVEYSMQHLDSLTVDDVEHRGSHDSFETITSGTFKRLSINSDTTVRDLSPSFFCDKSVATEQVFCVDKCMSTESPMKHPKASQTESCCYCTWCQNNRQVSTHLHSPLTHQSTVETDTDPSVSLNQDTTESFSDKIALTSFDSGFSPLKSETSVLNLFVCDGRILFCDNDSGNSSKWSRRYEADDEASTNNLHSNTRYPESIESVCRTSKIPRYTKNTQSGKPLHHLSLESLEEQPVGRRLEITIKEQILEYKKLLKLTNQRSSLQSFLKNPIPFYKPRLQIELWPEKQIDEHLQEENQLMQYAVQRYKCDLQIMESAFLCEFNRSNDLLSEEDISLMHELYDLWTEISLEVAHMEQLLSERQRTLRRGDSDLTTLSSLEIIPLMVEVMKEQLYVFHINNDILEISTDSYDQKSSPTPSWHHPGWKSVSEEVHELRHQLLGQNALQASHLKKAVEEIKDSLVMEIHKDVTQNFNRLFVS